MPQVQAQALRTVASVFRSRWLSDQIGLERAQRQLQEQLLNLRTITEDMLADQIAGSSATRLDQVTLAIYELAMLALGMPFGRPRPARPAAEALVRRLEQLVRWPQTFTGSGRAGRGLIRWRLPAAWAGRWAGGVR